MPFTDRTGNLSDMKSRIVSFMKVRGPSLPIHISKETKTTLLLSSAFLSDLASDKTIKISNMKVGGSPLYYLPGQEPMLEGFEKFLNGKEREALALIKQSKILRDDEQEPAIRVALRALKDFAHSVTVKQDDKTLIFWQHFSLSDEEAQKMITELLEPKAREQEKKEEKLVKAEEKVEKIESKVEKETAKEVKLEEPKIEIKAELIPISGKKVEDIFDTEKPEKKEEKPVRKKIKREKPNPDKFLNEIKQILHTKNIELINIERYDKKEVVALVRTGSSECLLFAFNKKRADESDILKANKRASLAKMPYSIICREDLSKKLRETIEAYKNLTSIDRINENKV